MLYKPPDDWTLSCCRWDCDGTGHVIGSKELSLSSNTKSSKFMSIDSVFSIVGKLTIYPSTTPSRWSVFAHCLFDTVLFNFDELDWSEKSIELFRPCLLLDFALDATAISRKACPTLSCVCFSSNSTQLHPNRCKNLPPPLCTESTISLITIDLCARDGAFAYLSWASAIKTRNRRFPMLSNANLFRPQITS